MNEEKMEIILVEPENQAITRGLDFLSLMEQFLAGQDVRAISKEVYRKGLERFFAWLASNNGSQPDRQTILNFKIYLQECGLSANTINSYLIGVRLFFSFLEGSRLYPNVAKTIKGVKQPRGQLKEVPTIPQAQELLGKIDIGSIAGKRDFAMINLMMRCGLRTCEVVRANIEDIRQEGGVPALFVQGKGRDSKDEFSVLTEKTLKPILDYLQTRNNPKPEEPLFISYSDRNAGQRLTTRTLSAIAKYYLREIGLNSKFITCHSFRHFFVTFALQGGAPLIQVQQAARHASIETTQRYIHNMDRIAGAAERFIDF
jgi:integrase/recombinase XerC/integrase/recombinase XerD